MKCLFCDDIYDNDSMLHWVKLKNGNHFRYVCDNGHFLDVSNKDNEIISNEVFWKPGIPGRQTTLNVFDFKYKQWITFDLKKEFNGINSWNRLCAMHDYTIKVKLDQIRQSRKMWLLCAKRLNLYKDIRILIGKYMNYEPIIFWK
jgi:hypothetical protein